MQSFVWVHPAPTSFVFLSLCAPNVYNDNYSNNNYHITMNVPACPFFCRMPALIHLGRRSNWDMQFRAAPLHLKIW